MYYASTLQHDAYKKSMTYRPIAQSTFGENFLSLLNLGSLGRIFIFWKAI
jgi:hypothetical protein